MDIWNALNIHVIPPYDGICEILLDTTAFTLNRRIEIETSESLNNFLQDYYNKYDLAHLYALNKALYEIIEVTSCRVIDGYHMDESEDYFRQLVESELGYCDEISNIINLDELIHELWEVAEDKHWSSDGRIETPKNMHILGDLSFHIQKRIENGPWELQEKTHAYMCSLTIGNYKRFDYESFTYQLSRGIECEETINNFIPYLQEDASGIGFSDAIQHSYRAKVLRFIQWAEIGNIGEHVKSFCNSITIVHPKIENGLDNYLWDALDTPFGLFRSDFALGYLNKKLTEYLLSCQFWLQNISKIDSYNKELLHIDYDKELHLVKMVISASYLFGAYRMGADKFDKSVLEDSASYLQTYQLPDTTFIDVNSISFNCIELNAMIVHALWISEAHGWKRSIQRIYDWIIKQSDPYGVWYHIDFGGRCYMTGLVLDTLELIKGGDKITFSLPSHKIKPGDVISSNNQQKLNTTLSNINIKTIQNILGNILQSSSAKGDLPFNAEQGNITIQASGPVYLKQTTEGDEDIKLNSLSPEDIKKQIEISQHVLLEDEINKALLIEYQRYDNEKQCDREVKRPSYRVLAKILHKNKVTDKIYSPEAIKQRVDKLIKAGLVTDYFAEKRREYKERTGSDYLVKNKGEENEDDQ